MTIQASGGRSGFNRRTLLTGTAALAPAAGPTYPRHVLSQTEKNHPLAGKSVRMAILGIAGWLPGKLGVDVSPDFAKYAKARYGCDVSFSIAKNKELDMRWYARPIRPSPTAPPIATASHREATPTPARWCNTSTC